jgi:maltose O-acetyltransferase
MPGVVVGAGAILAAGALANSDIPPNQLSGGVPARHIKNLPV